MKVNKKKKGTAWIKVRPKTKRLKWAKSRLVQKRPIRGHMRKAAE